ncbi:XRE family transcriptional regulator [Subdoligranulum sp. AM16-9]|mgnify:FL=1|nr:XRE family transcriptional regulator [Subdoligranulum sp. AM16-9]
MVFSMRLKELRKSRKLNQVDLGKIAGITSKQIQRYESGESEPTLSVLVRLSDYFDVSLDYLVGRSDVKEKQ